MKFPDQFDVYDPKTDVQVNDGAGDMSGKVVLTENLGRVEAGNYKKEINCQSLRKGVYLINVLCGKATTTSKLVVR